MLQSSSHRNHKQDRPPLPSSNSNRNPEAACVSFLFSPSCHTWKRSVAPARSPCPNFYCPILAVTSTWRCFVTRHPGSRKVKRRRWFVLLGEEWTPSRGGEDLVRLTFWRPPDPPAHKSCCLSQKRPATQVSSCCNKLLLTQDYGSFQIPPREQGNKHSLPGLSPSCFSRG